MVSNRQIIGVLVVTIVSALASAQAPLADAAALEQRLSEKRAERDRAKAEIEGLGGRRSAARERLKKRARALSRVGRSGFLPLAGGFAALLRHRSRLERLERLVQDDLDSLVRLRRRESALRSQIATVDEDIRAAQVALDEARDREAMAFASAERDAAFEAAFNGTPGGSASFDAPSGYGTIRVHGGDTYSLGGESFAEQRGRLSMPVAGSADVREGSREDGIGLELITAPGSTVLASADGRVAFADRYASYGRLVVLEHGDGYFTVYGGLGAVQVMSGESVMRGAPLGQVGPEGSTRGLYFEVRRGTRALDAPSWLGL